MPDFVAQLDYVQNIWPKSIRAHANAAEDEHAHIFFRRGRRLALQQTVLNVSGGDSGEGRQTLRWKRRRWKRTPLKLPTRNETTRHI